MKKVFTVNGLKCLHCKANVENSVRTLPGVEEAVASLEDNNLTVVYDESQVSPQQIKDSVAGAGCYEMIL